MGRAVVEDTGATTHPPLRDVTHAGAGVLPVLEVVDGPDVADALSALGVDEHGGAIGGRGQVDGAERGGGQDHAELAVGRVAEQLARGDHGAVGCVDAGGVVATVDDDDGLPCRLGVHVGPRQGRLRTRAAVAEVDVDALHGDLVTVPRGRVGHRAVDADHEGPVVAVGVHLQPGEVEDAVLEHLVGRVDVGAGAVVVARGIGQGAEQGPVVGADGDRATIDRRRPVGGDRGDGQLDDAGLDRHVDAEGTVGRGGPGQRRAGTDLDLDTVGGAGHGHGVTDDRRVRLGGGDGERRGRPLRCGDLGDLDVAVVDLVATTVVLDADVAGGVHPLGVGVGVVVDLHTIEQHLDAVAGDDQLVGVPLPRRVEGGVPGSHVGSLEVVDRPGGGVGVVGGVDLDLVTLLDGDPRVVARVGEPNEHAAVVVTGQLPVQPQPVGLEGVRVVQQAEPTLAEQGAVLLEGEAAGTGHDPFVGRRGGAVEQHPEAVVGRGGRGARRGGPVLQAEEVEGRGLPVAVVGGETHHRVRHVAQRSGPTDGVPGLAVGGPGGGQSDAVAGDPQPDAGLVDAGGQDR